MQTTKSKLHQAWLNYADIWSLSDNQQRLIALANRVNPNCVYTDPNIQVTGHDNLSEYMGQCQLNIPGLRFETTQFEEHHDRSLAKWNMVDGAGNVLGLGASFVLYGDEGQLLEMTGFFAQQQN
jgi:SnoaL-like domain